MAKSCLVFSLVCLQRIFIRIGSHSFKVEIGPHHSSSNFSFRRIATMFKIQCNLAPCDFNDFPPPPPPQLCLRSLYFNYTGLSAPLGALLILLLECSPLSSAREINLFRPWCKCPFPRELFPYSILKIVTQNLRWVTMRDKYCLFLFYFPLGNYILFIHAIYYLCPSKINSMSLESSVLVTDRGYCSYTHK